MRARLIPSLADCAARATTGSWELNVNGLVAGFVLARAQFGKVLRATEEEALPGVRGLRLR